MEKQLHLKKIGCSNCGAELIFDPGTQMTNCNFCGSQFQIEKAQDEEIATPDGILPFKVTKENYEQAVLSWLSEGDYTPDDILNSTIFESVNGVYLPMWFYKGRYNGNWSASSGYDRTETYLGKDSKGKTVEKTRTVTDWRPSSGQCSGEFAILAFAGAGKGIKSDIAVYAHGTSFNRGDLKPYDPKYTMGFNLIEYTVDESDTWDTLGKIQANSFVETETKPRIPGDRYKDFYVDALYDKENPLRTYVPFWITNYKYSDKDFHVYMDGTSTRRINGVRPEDQARKDVIKKLKNKIMIIGIAVTLLATVIAAKIANYDVVYESDRTAAPAIITFIIGIIVSAVISVIKVNKILNDSKARRQEILKNRLNSTE